MSIYDRKSAAEALGVATRMILAQLRREADHDPVTVHEASRQLTRIDVLNKTLSTVHGYWLAHEMDTESEASHE